MKKITLDYHGFHGQIDAPEGHLRGDRITVPIMPGLSTDPEEDGLVFEMVTFRADTGDATRYRCAGCLHCSAARLDARVFSRLAELARGAANEKRRRKKLLRRTGNPR